MRVHDNGKFGYAIRNDYDYRAGTTLVELEAEHEGISIQRGAARVSTSFKLPGTNKVTPSPATPFVDNGASMEEAKARIMDSMGEQNEQMSSRMSELETEVQVEKKPAGGNKLQ